MKKNLLLIIWLIGLTFPSVENSNEKTSSYLSAAQVQKPNNFISPSEVELNEKLQRIFYRAGPLGSNCLKNLHNQFHNKNRPEFRRPFRLIKPLRMPAFPNDGNYQQIPFFYRRRQNLFTEHQNTKRPFENGRIIFVSPYVKFNKKRVNFFQNANEFKINKTSQLNLLSSHEDLSHPKLKKVKSEVRQEISVEENPKQVEENIKLIKTFSLHGENREIEKQYITENSTRFDNVHEVSKTIKSNNYKTSEIPQKSNRGKLTTETYPKITSPHFSNQKKSIQTQPYEVEEIIEEGLNLENEKTDGVKNILFDGPTFLAKEIKKVTSSENDHKMNGIQDIMGSSISTVIKTLMSPVMKVVPAVENNRKTFIKKKGQNRPAFSKYLTTTSPRFITFSDQRSPNFHKTINSSRLLSSRHEQSKHLKIKNFQFNEKFQNWTRKTAELTADSKKITPELNSNNTVNIMLPLKIEYRKNVNTTDTAEILHTPSIVSETEKNIFNVKTTARTEIENVSLPFSEPNDQTLLTLFETQNILKGYTTQKTLNTKTEDLSTASSKTQETLNKILSSQELSATKTTRGTDLLNEFIENSTETKALPEVQYVNTPELSSGIAMHKADLSIPDFQSFTDHPTTFDLITTIKSDFRKNQDVMGKNGRKMHFPYEFDGTTMSDLIAELGNTGPRRSDILISENFNDSVEDNILSSLNYLDKLKQNNSFPYRNSLPHPMFESIIPLIPVIINDLREGRISPKDISILSEAFGKYWSSIVVLANVTNLDILPLLEMKNEEDWNNIWQSFLPETTSNIELTTVKTTEVYAKQEGDDYSPYDYLTEYKDFYKYVFESQKEEKEKKRKKARLKTDERDAFRVYFEKAEEEEENPMRSNMYKDVYVESLEGKDSSEV